MELFFLTYESGPRTQSLGLGLDNKCGDRLIAELYRDGDADMQRRSQRHV